MIAATQALTFLAPGFFVLLALALVPWVGPFATRDRRHAALRSALFVLLALALARPVRVVPSELTHHVVVLDRSASFDHDAARETEAFAAEHAADRASRVTVIELGRGPSDDRAPLMLPAGVQHLTLGGDGESPLGAALATAARVIPPGAAGRVVVHSDGLATEPLDGSAAAHAIADLGARGITIELTPDLTGLRFGEPADLRPVGLTADGPARVGLAVALTARLVGVGQTVTCRLLERSQEAGGADIEVDRAEGVVVDGDTRVALTYEPSKAGFAALALEVEVTAGTDPRPGDTRLERTLAVQDPLRVLYLGERVTGSGDALGALLGAGFALAGPVTDPAEGAALDASELDGVDLVVVDDRPAASVPEDFQRALVAAVTDRGVGLVAAGGEAAFGPGGYHEQPLEAVLPVEFVQKEEKRDPSTTLVVIIDTSGSMGGNRVQLAKEVSRLAIRRLLPHDKVGMVEFYGAKRWAVPIQPASNSIEIERALNRLDAGGGTVILPAIEEAYYGLKNVRTRFKHVLILTDGGVETGAFEPLLRRMADEGMNVSTVLIGGDAHSEFLVDLANWGQGRFYSVPNRFNLPEILLKQPASAKLPAYRSGVAAVRVRGGDAWFGPQVDGAPSKRVLPPVAGYVETRARPGAERVIETAAEGHPVLASWRYGLGRVTALTTEPTGPGSAPWRTDSAYGDWLARALERTAADTEAPFVFALTREGGEALLVAERRAGGDVANTLSPRAELVRDGAARAPLGFTRTAPDRYEVRWPAAFDTAVAVECSVARALPDDTNEARVGGITRLVQDPLAGPRAERQVPPEARTALDGLVARAAAQAAATTAPRGVTRLREYAPWLAALALALYLLDILYRRWPRTRAPFA